MGDESKDDRHLCVCQSVVGWLVGPSRLARGNKGVWSGKVWIKHIIIIVI